METNVDLFGEIIEELYVDVPIEARIELAEDDFEDEFESLSLTQLSQAPIFFIYFILYFFFSIKD